MVRLVRFIPAFRSLAHTLLVTVKSMTWPLLLLSMVIYGFSVTFVSALADHYGTGGSNSPACEKFFGSLGLGMLSLFFSITGGQDWNEVLSPLQELGDFWVVLFIL